jgi:hypothetical protein
VLFAVGRYEYQNSDGSYVLKDNKHKKTFRQKRPDPDRRGKWISNIDGVRVVPYRLPEVIEAIGNDNPIAIVEGEAKVDLLRSWNVPATCNAGGAGKWKPEHSAFLRGADVVILPDNDEPGRNHADLVGASLQGIAKSVRVLELPGLPPKGDIIDWAKQGGTVEQLYDLSKREAKRWTPRTKPEQQAANEEIKKPAEQQPDSGLEVFDAGLDIELPPPRGWLLGNQFCRGFLSSLVAPGAAGKTALRIAQLLSLATARNLTGQHVFMRCRVLLLSFEDGRDELQRRLAAARLHHNVSLSELKGWLYYATPKGTKLAELQNGSRQRGQLAQWLRDKIEQLKPDIVCLDPFVKTHALEENDNGAMDFVCDLLATFADDYNIAVDAPHHTRKGITTPGDPDMGRGSSSIRDAGRLVYTLTPMDETEAKQFSIEQLDRRSFVRLDSAKVNIARPANTATWFKLVSVNIGNATEAYPNGDEVQTVVPWSPPKAWEGLSSIILNAALTEIDAGLSNGQRYTDKGGGKGERAAWKVVQKHCPNRTESQCREIIKTWIKNDVLYAVEYDDPVERKKRNGLRLDTSKRPT